MLRSRMIPWFTAVSMAMRLAAQEPYGVFTATVADATTARPIPMATVTLEPSDPLIGMATDSMGRASLRHVPVGLYTVRVRSLGHETLAVPEVWVRAGKETVLRVELSPAAFALETFTVSAMGRDLLGAWGTRTFTVEQGLRYPAMFQDPARLIGSTPGVTVPNDQANHLVVRGNGPLMNAWCLEGAEIVSPNHLGNAGTPTDLPTLNGGGVNILSAQLLGPSRFHTGVMPAMHGNALGGLMDMELRRGNTQGREWTLQAGLLGIDVATEGPVGKEGRAFHLVNYRYSTIGLLTAMGVEVSEEAISFQDLAFHAGTRIGARGELRVFGIGGLSSNVFTASRDTADWEYDRDSRNVTYTSAMGALGGTFATRVGERIALHGTVVWSALDQRRAETALNDDLEPAFERNDSLGEAKLSTMLRCEGAAGARWHWTAGVGAMERSVQNLWGQRASGWALRPFAQARWAVTEHLHATAGAAFCHFTYNGSQLLEPRADLTWRFRKGHRLAAAYGVRGQLPWHHLLYLGDPVEPLLDPRLPDNRDLGLMRSVDLTLGYHHAVNDRLSVRVEVHDQRISGVPQTARQWTTASIEPMGTVNAWDQPLRLPQEADGNGRNTGVELSVARTFDRGWFAQTNGCLFQSTWDMRSGGTWNSRWNGGWAANAMAGREWRKPKDDRVRTWGVSVRAYAYGGLRYTPFEVRNSGSTPFILASGDPFSAQLKDFFRTDLRIYLKKDRSARTSQWAVDVQNLTNVRNEAYRYYDRRQGAILTKHQLGLIPNLSYRIEF